MKKTTLTVLILMINFAIFADESFQQIFSPKALELIREYTPRVTNPKTKIPVSPFLNKEKHLIEEYRSAWEELYCVNVTNKFATHSIPIGGIADVLSMIGSTNSIPMLVEVYSQLLESNKDENQKQRKEILNILFNINAPETLDIIFFLLDLSDTKYESDSPYQKRTGMTLREWVWQDRLNPKFIGDTFIKTQDRIERAEQWREKFNAYQNPNLSEKNQLFIEKARNLSRTPEEQNKNANVPLP